MLVGFLSFIIFLFCTYQLTKDDFVLLRKNVTVGNVFDALFLGLPVVLFVSRIVYVVLHPSWQYINPLIFFIVPYFPGLSLQGGIIGALLFGFVYTRMKKIPTSRFFDIVSISFLLAFAFSILFQGASYFFSNKLLAIEEIGRSMLAVACFIFVLAQFLKSRWREGSATYNVILMYCLLVLISMGFALLSHKHILVGQVIITGVLFASSILFYLYKRYPFRIHMKK